jgi:hypothetical protein
MNFYADFKELSAWIIGVGSLLIMLVLIYYRSYKERSKT